MSKFLSDIPCIAMMRQPSNAITHRAFLTGVLRYEHMYGPWNCIMVNDKEQSPAQIRRVLSGIDGVIGSPYSILRPNDKSIVDVPTVLTASYDRAETLARRRLRQIVGIVRCDNAAVGQTAAQHFIERKFTHFAYVGTQEKTIWSDERRQAFVREAGHVHVYRFNSVPLADWLAALPRPCGVFAANDTLARTTLDACRVARLNVPTDIAIIGCDDDNLVCSTATPQLSSIRMDIESTGFAAAKLLDRVLRNGRQAPEKIVNLNYGVSEIAVRASSDTRNLGDPLVERAMARIGLNVTVRFTVRELAQQLNVSTRLLEIHFRKILGCSVRDEIMRQRVLRVKRLLAESTSSLETIAENCGFASASHLCTVFKRTLGISPSACRRT